MPRSYFLLRDGYQTIAIHQVRDSAEACMAQYINSKPYTMSLELVQVVVNECGFAQEESVLKIYSSLTGVYSDCSGNNIPPPPIRIPKPRTSASKPADCSAGGSRKA
jgi:hypothetical protein